MDAGWSHQSWTARQTSYLFPVVREEKRVAISSLTQRRKRSPPQKKGGGGRDYSLIWPLMSPLWVKDMDCLLLQRLPLASLRCMPEVSPCCLLQL